MSFQLVVQLTQEFQKKICSPNISDSTVSKDIKKKCLSENCHNAFKYFV